MRARVYLSLAVHNKTERQTVTETQADTDTGQWQSYSPSNSTAEAETTVRRQSQSYQTTRRQAPSISKITVLRWWHVYIIIAMDLTQ